MREKLIELLKESLSFCGSSHTCKGCAYDYQGRDCMDMARADYLIANGVTVREKGEWVDGVHCSECGAVHEYREYRNSRNYCPNCGADMRGEEHE